LDVQPKVLSCETESPPRLPDDLQVVKVGSKHYGFCVQVTINGEPHGLEDGLTIADLIIQLGLRERRIAVELNREILGRERYATQAVAEGDAIEIVHFVGGG